VHGSCARYHPPPSSQNERHSQLCDALNDCTAEMSTLRAPLTLLAFADAALDGALIVSSSSQIYALS
jgi:hypothetical protein